MSLSYFTTKSYSVPSRTRRKPELAFIFFITSANVSSNQTGEEEPAHYLTLPAAQNLSHLGIPILGNSQEDEEIIQQRYAHLIPSSTSILSLHKVVSRVNNFPTLVIERHGSADISLIQDIVRPFGFGAQPAARAERLSIRNYS